jgi:sorting nexin-29
MEKTSEYGIKTYYLFINFKAPYDSINRQSLYLAMRDMGIPAKLIRLTKLTMTNNCVMVKLSRQFDIKEGVRQGDPLACLLFNINLEKVIRDAEVETWGTVFNKSVQILAYVDDIVVTGYSLAVVKATFIKMEKADKQMGLTVNENKTKFMALNDPAY